MKKSWKKVLLVLAVPVAVVYFFFFVLLISIQMEAIMANGFFKEIVPLILLVLIGGIPIWVGIIVLGRKLKRRKAENMDQISVKALPEGKLINMNSPQRTENNSIQSGFTQTNGEKHDLDVSAISGMPYKFTIDGAKYSLDLPEDVYRLPVLLQSFFINDKEYHLSEYLRLIAPMYEEKGYRVTYEALREKAYELERNESYRIRFRLPPLQATTTDYTYPSAPPIFDLPPEYDELLPQAAQIVVKAKSCSVSMLQRMLKVGYSRAAHITDQLDAVGIIGPYAGATPRSVLVCEDNLYDIFTNLPRKGEKESEIDTDAIIKRENEWLREQRGLSVVDNELYLADHMDGHSFEGWCAERLRNAGFVNVSVTPGSGDQGVDVLAEKDGIKYAIQCKCYSNDLGNTPIQEVNSGKQFYHCHVGVVMTNRYFTAGAKEIAAATGTLLWDRDKLQEMLQHEASI